jgi:hypothetical protein
VAKDDSLGSLFKKAKKWATEEVKNATKIGADPRDQKDAEQQNERRLREIESDAKLMRDAAIADALTPQSIKDLVAMQAANRAAQSAATDAAARADRVARAGESRVELSGYMEGTADGLAVEAWNSGDGSSLAVAVECVDPVPMKNATVKGFGFVIPAFHGDGTYTLDDENLDSSGYMLDIVEDNEGWGFHPSFGPGEIVVSDGTADVHLAIGSSGNETVDLRATVVLPAVVPD